MELSTSDEIRDFITCKAPLGYFFKNNTLVPDPKEIPIVKYIFNSYLAGKSLEEIADELNEAELKSDKKIQNNGMLPLYDIS